MKVLVACECSGVVRRAFAARGHDAWSCDLKPAEDGSDHHIQGDAIEALARGWDLIIAHPPCTYLSVSGMHWTSRGLRDPKLTEDALALFRAFLDATAPMVCVENPVGVASTRIRPADQWVQPFEFGDDASKKTGLWLRGLPILKPTIRRNGRLVEWPRGSGRMVERWGNQTDSGQNRLGPSEQRAAERAVTYPGIANAMADQWGAGVFRFERQEELSTHKTDTKKMKKRKHGGRREGAGRKPEGRKGYLIRMKPETHGHLKAVAKEAGSSVGQVIEAMVENR